MDDDERSQAVAALASELFETTRAMLRASDRMARGLGQSQARWHVMWMAEQGSFTVPAIARRLGLTRQSVQRVADALVTDQLARYTPNPDHARSPLLALTGDGREILARLDRAQQKRNLSAADALGDSGVARLRELAAVLRAVVPSDEADAADLRGRS